MGNKDNKQLTAADIIPQCKSITLTDEVKAHIEEEFETFPYKTGSKMKEACIHNIVLLKDESHGSPSINPECLHLSALGCHVTKLKNYMKE